MVVRLVNPPMETSTWYEAPPPERADGSPGRRSRRSSGCDPRSPGLCAVTVVPAVSVAIMLLGFSWQSVDRHQTSAPLEIVKTCVVEPTSSVQSFVPLLVKEMESFGRTPAA